MKQIQAIIQPHKIEDVMEALHELGIVGMTTLEVKGYGRQKGKSEIYRGAEYQVQFVPKTLVLVSVPERQCAPAVEAIEKIAKTGKTGDGKIFVVPLEEAVRIRTGERGDTAL